MRHVNKTFSFLIAISFHLNSTFTLNGTGQFKKLEKSVSERNVWLVNRFHPTEPVLALFSSLIDDQMMLLFAENSSIPFSNWKEKELQLEIGNFRELETIEWNVSRAFQIF
jgi:hypothetical protein